MEITRRCIDAGMHVHLDKPGGESFSAFKKVLDEAERRDLTVQLGYMYRNNPAMQFCFQAVREGWLGEIFEVHSVMNRDQPLSYLKWLSQFRGGTMFIFAGHLIDLVVTIMGKPDRITGLSAAEPVGGSNSTITASPCSSIHGLPPRFARLRLKLAGTSVGNSSCAATKERSKFGRWNRLNCGSRWRNLAVRSRRHPGRYPAVDTRAVRRAFARIGPDHPW